MKTLINRIILIALLGLSVLVDKASAATYSASHPLTSVWLTSSSGGYAGTNLYSGAFLLESVTLQNTNVAAQRVSLYDSSVAALQNIANMVSYTSYSSNKVTTFTTFGGTTQNNTNTVWFTTKNAAADVTTWKANPASLVLPGGAATAASVITYTFDPPLQLYSGLSVTNTAIGITVTISGTPGTNPQ